MAQTLTYGVRRQADDDVREGHPHDGWRQADGGGSSRPSAGASAEPPAGPEAHEATKVCPRCGAELFADMDVCYGCLYDFTRPTEDGGPGWAAPYGGRRDGRPDGADAVPDDLCDLDEPPQAYGEQASPRHPAFEPGGGSSPAGHQPRHAQPRPVRAPAGPSHDADLQESWEESWAGRRGDREPSGGAPMRPAEDADACACRLDETDDLLGGTAPLPRHAPASHAGIPQVAGPVGEACEASSLSAWIRSGDMEVTVPILPRGLVFGRSPSCDVVLHSRAVSHRHIRLSADGRGAMAEDLGATNPAILHGRQVTGPVPMRPGDTLDICGTLVTVVRAHGSAS